jgi:hypothetical protein
MAAIKTPIVPVKFNFNCFASFLAFRSSIMSKQSSFSIASANALASPGQEMILKFVDNLFLQKN